MPPMNEQLWRSLEERADTAEFRAWLHREFPPLASEWTDEVSRRHFLKLMGASLALAGLGACTKQPLEKIVPYVKQPPEVVPGKPLHFASALTLGGYARGVIVESNEGRPTKIEGNPRHPANLGSTDVFMQAAILDLYDPDRSQNVLEGGAISTWENFLSALDDVLRNQQQSGGAGIRILTQTLTSPTLHEQLRAFLTKYPAAKWHQWEPINRDNVREGARLAFGEIVETIYHFDKAAVVVSLAANFLGEGPGQLRYVRDFVKGRRAVTGVEKMNRLYVAEATPTITGAMADHRAAVSPDGVRALAEALAAKLGVTSSQPASIPDAAWLESAAQTLAAHRGASIVIAGVEQPPEVHAIAQRINAALGNVGQTIVYTTSSEPEPGNQLQSLRELTADMSAGRVAALFILGGNPVFDAPADFAFGQALERVPWRMHLGTHANETAAQCQWHVPEPHALEAWSDARAFDGTASIMQPLIAPLYDSKNAHEFFAAALGTVNASSYEIVRDYWNRQGFDDVKWHATVQEGIVPNTASPPKNVTLVAQTNLPVPQKVSEGMELIFREDPAVYDGRFCNNAWLQELPRPLTKLTWDNAALISPQTAQQLDLHEGDVVEIKQREYSIEAPILIQPGHADGALTLHFGYGRTAAGRVGNGVGFNAFALRTSDALWHARGAAVRKVGRAMKLVVTQHHQSIEGRHLLRVAARNDFLKDPKMIRELTHVPPEDETLYRPQDHPYKNYAWGMAIDLSTCIGCNACVIACVAENNIPVVGKGEVARGREMHWIRIDRYYEGAVENPRTYFQPVPCMHCENAPCELVCPVGATVHDSEGLNVQVYNRCIGTRYCSNNCPYKVRRFNFLAYDAGEFESAPVLKLQRNPEVTVRSRGVMEKCTYCTQRIEAARITAEEESRPIRDGEITPACAEACPAEAIIFGDINDPRSRVARLKSSPLNYAMLSELNTRPRTTYLARILNP